MIRSLLILALLCPSAFAANWYVDNSATGSNNGTSWENAWQAFSNITTAIGPGDTIYLSGGSTSKTYSETNFVAPFGGMLFSVEGGTLGNPITYTVGTDSGHNGRVILDAQGLRYFMCVYFGHNYLVLDGGPNTNFWIINANNQSGDAGEARQRGIGYYGGGATGNRVWRIGVSNCINGITSNGATDFEVASNRVVYILGDVGIGTANQSEDFNNTRIHHNYVQSILDEGGTPSTRLGGPDGISHMTGTSIYNNELINTLDAGWTNGSGQHPDAIQSSGFVSDVRVWNNRIHSFYNSVFEWDTWGANPKEIYVWGNVMSHDDPNIDGASHTLGENALDATSITVSNFYFFNNTCVGFNSPAYAFSIWWDKSGTENTPTLTNVFFLNNIIYNCGWADAPSGEGAAFTMGNYTQANWHSNSTLFAYNLINAGTEGEERGAVRLRYAPGAVGGYDLTNRGGIYLGPEFSGYSGEPSLANTFTLQSGSPAIGAGTNLTALLVSLGVAATDISGNVWPAEGQWEIGAYEFGSSGGIWNVTTLNVGTLNIGTQ